MPVTTLNKSAAHRLVQHRFDTLGCFRFYYPGITTSVKVHGHCLGSCIQLLRDQLQTSSGAIQFVHRTLFLPFNFGVFCAEDYTTLGCQGFGVVRLRNFEFIRSIPGYPGYPGSCRWETFLFPNESA
eukprot:915230-Rhodomonas_salina.1